MNQLGIQKKNELKFHYFILILIITEHLPNLDSPSMPLIKTWGDFLEGACQCLSFITIVFITWHKLIRVWVD